MLGSIDFAMTALSESVKVVVMPAIAAAGVTGAVDAYLRPLKYWSKTTNMLKSIFRHIFVSVREAANGLAEVWGEDAREIPGYREALLEIAVTLNGCKVGLRPGTGSRCAGKWEIEVFYTGVDDTPEPSRQHAVRLVGHRRQCRGDPPCPRTIESPRVLGPGDRDRKDTQAGRYSEDPPRARAGCDDHTPVADVER